MHLVRVVLCAALVATALAPLSTREADAARSDLRQAARAIVFEANAGQTHEDAKFVARAPGYRLFLTEDGAVVSLARQAERYAVRLRFAGSAGAARISGVEQLPGKVNYLLGDDPSAWQTGVETFARVRYEGIYPGVDAVFYSRDGELEYDFVVAPGADPRVVALEVDGAERIEIDAAGDLVAHTPLGPLRHRRPLVYQEANGSRVVVPSRYELDGSRAVFALGDYDRSRALVIDPVLSYSTYIVGSGDESGAGVAVDAAGNAYVVGGSSSLDFPTTIGALQPAIAGAADGFVAKLNADGSAYIFSTYIGGSGDEGIARAALDGSGTVFIAGGTSSTDWPTSTTAFDTTFNGGSFDGFAAKLAADGASLLYSTYLGGSGDDGIAAVAVDSSGNAYLTGGATSNNYPTTPGAFDTSNASILGLPDAVVTKLSADGTALLYSTYLGGGFNLEAGAAVAVDSSGNAYVAGATNGGFPTTSGALDTSFNGGTFDGFVTKINPSGSGLVYSTYLGAGGEDYVFGLGLDGSGNTYLTGYTDSTSFPTASAFQPTNGGGFDAYVTKLNASGTGLVYSSYIGGSGNEGLTSNLGTELQIAGAIAVDAAGNAYLTGFTDSTDFPIASAWQRELGGGFDTWVAKVTSSGAKEYASYMGGAAEERGLGIAVDTSGSAYVTGFTLSTNFPTTLAVVHRTPAGNLLTDGFLAKIGTAPGDTAGIYTPSDGTWFLRPSNTPGNGIAPFIYGLGGARFVALAGDWDGNGTDTVGIYDNTTGDFFLKNRNAGGNADLAFQFGVGGPGYVPIVGDWDGDGADTVGIYETATGFFFLKNENSNGPADLTFQFGIGGAEIIPVRGDWDGDGDDTVGIYNSTTGVFFLRNSNEPGNADLTFQFGVGGATVLPLSGDWDADGDDTIGIYAASSGTWFLKNENSNGPADLAFIYGPPGAVPITGHWGG